MPIKDEIRAYIVDNILFGDDELLADDASFQDVGILDSAGFLEIIAFFEERFCITIEDSEVSPENFDTLQRMADYIGTKRSLKTPA